MSFPSSCVIWQSLKGLPFSCIAFVMWKSVCISTIRLLERYSGRTAHLARLRSILRIQLGVSPSGWGELPQCLMSSNWLCLASWEVWNWIRKLYWLESSHISNVVGRKSCQAFLQTFPLWPAMSLRTLSDFLGDPIRGPLKGNMDSKEGL